MSHFPKVLSDVIVANADAIANDLPLGYTDALGGSATFTPVALAAYSDIINSSITVQSELDEVYLFF